MEANLHIYEALADAGIEPLKARRIERAILWDVSEGQSRMEKNLFERMMTKEDGLRLEKNLTEDNLRLERMFKEDSLRLEQKLLGEIHGGLYGLHGEIQGLRSDMLSKLNEQLRWYVGLMFIAVTASTTIVGMLR
jgi:hypothetical protein